MKSEIIYNNVEIIDAGSEGKAVARVGELVLFVPFVVPGDVVDIKLTKKKRSYLEGKAIRFHKYSEKREKEFCNHFGTCGGCRWQNMKYCDQLYYKQKQVEDALRRIARIPDAKVLPILPSSETRYYRNKLEYTFSNHRWMTENDPPDLGPDALGFHIPLLFDKVLDIKECFLQRDPSNAIRLESKKFAIDNGYSFYDVRKWVGFMRGIIIRVSNDGGLMTIFMFHDPDMEKITSFLDHILKKFPEISSMYYVVNPKKNDVITDLPVNLYYGKPYITEKLLSFRTKKEIEFHIGPLSFYQTNSSQVPSLYGAVASLAGFNGSENVYDLYSGIGSISSFISDSVNRVIGIESIPAAVNDANENAKRNKITNMKFFTGETEKLLSEEFIREQGKPDIIITDPPRSGMHEKTVKAMILAAPEKVVYVSCNPSTQARDLALLQEKYDFKVSQPVDMFPHTQHVENVALLVRRAE
ncbi:MAG: 23S rRNA (uracil(1939)-C(5))-methyltransferase RlmD [Bacteroidota bacterium]|nr:23S rRNA (uracil(1939)-C(5))-methyltransferase RlmD [Bacteroidota bacterium]